MKNILLIFILMLFNFVTYGQDHSLHKKHTENTQIQAALNEINADSIYANALLLQNFGTRFTLAPNRKNVAIWLKNKFISIGYQNAFIDSFLIHKIWNSVTYDIYQYNIIASIQGTTNQNQVYVLGAHYDSFSQPSAISDAPGADDNASGTAATIEVARVMKLENFQPASTIQFVLFGAEELMGSPGCGSCDYAEKAVANNKDIRMMLNYDMISNASSSINHVVNINRYDNSEWLSKFSINLITEYTNLSILLAPQFNSNGSDSWNFYKANFPTIYFEEAQFSPVYHSPNDLVSNCNYSYCAEVAKISCAILMEDASRPVIRKIVALPKNGKMEVAWNKISGANILGYNLYRALSPGNDFEKINQSLLHDTTFIDTEVTPLTWYYYAAVTVNSSIEESATTTVDSSFIPTFNQGILIVDDSQNEFQNPADIIVDNFYDSLFTGYPHTQFDILNVGSIGLAELGKYSTLVWHTDKYTGTSKFKSAIDVIKKYLQYGGKMILTTERFGPTINHNLVLHDTYEQNEFPNEILHLDSMYKNSLSRFDGGKSASPGYPDLFVDTLKTPATFNHHLSNIESIYTSKGEVIYTYDTQFDSLSTLGCMKGLPIGIEYLGNDYKLILLTFPLWYIRMPEAKELINFIMEHKFNDPSQVQNLSESVKNVVLFPSSPNPFNNQTSVRFYLPENTFTHLELYSATGTMMTKIAHKEMQSGFHTMNFSAENLSSGIYYIVLHGTGFYKTTKVVVIK